MAATAPSQADLNEIFNTAVQTGLGYVQARESTKQANAAAKAEAAKSKFAEITANKNFQIGAGILAAILLAFLIFKKR